MTDLDAAEQERLVRLAASGAVGASVAHELRNALAVAESSLYLAQRDLADDDGKRPLDRPRLVRHLEQVAREIRKAHSVIGSVLGLARGEPVQREPVAVGALIETARHALTLPRNVLFEVAIEPVDLTIAADPVLIERVFSNLYLNAIEALGERRGTIVTRAWLGESRSYLEVEDDGPGLDAKVVDCLFQPLVTAKASGTGLGLSLSRTIIEAHGGEITAGPGPRGGAAFRMWLPNA